MEEQVSISQNQIKSIPIGRFGEQAAPVRNSAEHSVYTEVPRWTVVVAGAAPVLLVAGFLLAARLQPGPYDSLRDTISSLAARGAVDPWVMTTAIASVGACYLATALGLSPARPVGRLALAGAGIATLSIAAFPTPLHGYSRPHAFGVIAASITMSAWPVLASHRQHRSRLLRFGPNVVASAVTLGLILMWFIFEIKGGEVGLAERCATVVPALWLFPVTLGARRAIVPDGAAELGGVAQPAETPDRFMDLERKYDSRRPAST
jgi:hypothetical membrane protein